MLVDLERRGRPIHVQVTKADLVPQSLRVAAQIRGEMGLDEWPILVTANQDSRRLGHGVESFLTPIHRLLWLLASGVQPGPEAGSS